MRYEELEKEYATFAKTNYAVSCNSGTSALHLALVALGVTEGDEVIVPDFTMASCAFSVSYTGATPVFVDCGDNLNIDPELIKAKITSRTKAIMVVHIYGRLCNLDAIRALAKAHRLSIIEDACEAQGITDGLSDITVFSFYRNKIIHAEEGGIVCTNSKEIADNVRDFKNLSFGERHDYYHERIGWNYRMPDAMAQMALQSLKDYPINLEKRREVESWYAKRIKSNLPPRDTVWVYDFITPFKNELMQDSQLKLKARHFFKPMSTMPMYRQEVGRNALLYSENGMYLPVYPEMTKDEVNQICDLVLNKV